MQRSVTLLQGEWLQLTDDLGISMAPGLLQSVWESMDCTGTQLRNVTVLYILLYMILKLAVISGSSHFMQAAVWCFAKRFFSGSLNVKTTQAPCKPAAGELHTPFLFFDQNQQLAIGRQQHCMQHLFLRIPFPRTMPMGTLRAAGSGPCLSS